MLPDIKQIILANMNAEMCNCISQGSAAADVMI